MTTATDPDPDNTPGLEAGGAVSPGDTPPASASTSGLSHRQPPPGKWIPRIFLGGIALLVLAFLGLAVGHLTSILRLF